MKTETTQKSNAYSCLSQRRHVLERPDMYISSINSQINEDVFLFDDETEKIINKKKILVNDGIIRIFQEVLSNCIDNYERSKHTSTPMTLLKVTYNEENNEIEFLNDGLSIPIEKYIHSNDDDDDDDTTNKKLKDLYIPEVIFGELLTGSNYKKGTHRTTSGRNGVGVKVASIFSKQFTVSISDPERQLTYKQVWKDSMKKKGKAIIKKKENAKTPQKGYTKIAYQLDFSLFDRNSKEPDGSSTKEPNDNDNKSYNADTIGIFKKLLLDASMIMNIPVYFNKQKFFCRKMADYVEKFSLFENKKETLEGKFSEGKNEIEYFVLPTTLLASSTIHQISFVNGICTTDGGVHIETFLQKFYTSLLKNSKLKKINVTAKDLKRHFFTFLKTTLINPSFSSQSKTKLISSKVNLNKLIEFTETEEKKIITKTSKWPFVEKLLQENQIKESLSIKKNLENKRGSSFLSIPGYDRANQAGTKTGSVDCTLLVTEGLSAKNYATKAITFSKHIKTPSTQKKKHLKPRDIYGIFALRGKVLNVRNASKSITGNNSEIQNLCKILNLKLNMDYTIDENFNTIHYQKGVMFLCDSDEDGAHISSLLLNFFSYMFPSLLRRTGNSFLQIMFTPVAKIKFSNQSLNFFSDYEYKCKINELQESQTKFSVRYYKGLGTSSNEEVKESAFEKVVSFEFKEDADTLTLEKCFSSNMTVERKNWLMEYDVKNYIVPEKVMSFSHYLNQELIQYSIADCKRSLPSLLDGLKESQRKILFTLFKRNLHYKSSPIKVAQLAASCAEMTHYRHGEQNLADTIIKLAHDFPTSNNIPLLEACGQFGSRTEKGSDAASARYIYTKLSKLSSTILFNSDDFDLLPFNFEDGVEAEYSYFLPIIPLCLTQGLKGIATGWSSSIPPFHVNDIIQKLYFLLKQYDNHSDDTSQKNMLLESFKTAEEIPRLVPYYKNFTGTIKEDVHNKNKFICEGKLLVKKNEDKNNKVVYQVTEIPVSESIQSYKQFLEKLLDTKKIKDLKNYSSADYPLFEFKKGEKANDRFFDDLSNLKLVTSIGISNMTLFDANEKITTYSSTDEILVDFFLFRIKHYKQRILLKKDRLSSEITLLQEKKRFILDVLVNKKIILFNKSQQEIEQNLISLQYHQQERSSKHKFDYLLSIPVKSFTKEYYTDLDKEILSLQGQYDYYCKISATQLWKKELQALEKEINKI